LDRVIGAAADFVERILGLHATLLIPARASPTAGNISKAFLVALALAASMFSIVVALVLLAFLVVSLRVDVVCDFDFLVYVIPLASRAHTRRTSIGRWGRFELLECG
jgi:hypothetical protein